MPAKDGTSRKQTIESIVDDLERNLRALDLWQQRRPPESTFRSEMPFSFDTMKLHEWLQWRLIPRMRRILREGDELPESSAILPYAEEYFSKCERDVTELLFVIENFDEIISGTRSPTKH